MYFASTSTDGIPSQSRLSSGDKLESYVEADYALKASDRRSVSGGEVVMCSGPWVSFYSRTSKCVIFPSTEAEYVAMAARFPETIFRRYTWSFVSPGRDVGCTTVKEGSMGAIN